MVLAGSVQEGVDLSGVRTRGAIAWVMVVPGESLSGVVTTAPLEPRLFSYALAVRGPPPAPHTATSRGELPDGLQSDEAAMLFGLPFLYEGDDVVPPTLQVEPSILMDWILGDADTLDGFVTNRHAEVAAVARDHVLMALATDGEVALASLPSWTPGGPACRVDGMVPGLTLYRQEGSACGSWRALAPAGERTEFQGVDMGSVHP
jgi:hypothetical protein